STERSCGRRREPGTAVRIPVPDPSWQHTCPTFASRRAGLRTGVIPHPERIMPSRPPVLRLVALVLFTLAAPAAALETRCVNTVTEIRNALLAADDDDMQINVVRGTYSFSSDPMDSAPEPSLGYNVT